MASRASRTTRDLCGNSRRNDAAAPIPEIPAPMTTTSNSSRSSAGVVAVVDVLAVCVMRGAMVASTPSAQQRQQAQQCTAAGAGCTRAAPGRDVDLAGQAQEGLDLRLST